MVDVFRHVRLSIPPESVQVVFPYTHRGFSHSREEHDSIVDACGLLILHV